MGSSGGGSTSMGSSGGGSTSMGCPWSLTAVVRARWNRALFLLSLLRLMVMAGPLLLFGSGAPSSLFPLKITLSSTLALLVLDMAATCPARSETSAPGGAAATKETAVTWGRFYTGTCSAAAGSGRSAQDEEGAGEQGTGRELQGAPCAQRAALLSGQQEATEEPKPTKGPSASFPLSLLPHGNPLLGLGHAAHSGTLRDLLSSAQTTAGSKVDLTTPASWETEAPASISASRASSCWALKHYLQ